MKPAAPFQIGDIVFLSTTVFNQKNDNKPILYKYIITNIYQDYDKKWIVDVSSKIPTTSILKYIKNFIPTELYDIAAERFLKSTEELETEYIAQKYNL